MNGSIWKGIYFIGMPVEERHLHKQHVAWITETAMTLMFYLTLWLPITVTKELHLMTNSNCLLFCFYFYAYHCLFKNVFIPTFLNSSLTVSHTEIPFLTSFHLGLQPLSSVKCTCFNTEGNAAAACSHWARWLLCPVLAFLTNIRKTNLAALQRGLLQASLTLGLLQEEQTFSKETISAVHSVPPTDTQKISFWLGQLVLQPYKSQSVGSTGRVLIYLWVLCKHVLGDFPLLEQCLLAEAVKVQLGCSLPKEVYLMNSIVNSNSYGIVEKAACWNNIFLVRLQIWLIQQKRWHQMGAWLMAHVSRV